MARSQDVRKKRAPPNDIQDRKPKKARLKTADDEPPAKRARTKVVSTMLRRRSENASLPGIVEPEAKRQKRGRNDTASKRPRDDVKDTTATQEEDPINLSLITKRRFSRKKAAPPRPRVYVFTGFTDEDDTLNDYRDAKKQFQALFEQELVTVTNEWNDSVTHVIANGRPFKRTQKVLCGLSKGLPVLSIKYIHECIQARVLMLEDNFEYRHLLAARRRAAQERLLADFTAVFLFPTVKNRNWWSAVIEAAGGRVATCFPLKSEHVRGRILLLTCPSGPTHMLTQRLQRHGIQSALYSIDLLREAFLSQELDLDRHELRG
eukprot:GEMP01025752.1.p1 GENE.GEMP01025752.1~~GEMP01025752.1.p1  ORF type:complete len:328 (+),score=76.54 GEMP01025752.1:26-985(+)